MARRFGSLHMSGRNIAIGLILVLCIGFVSASLIASIGQQGLSLISPELGSAVNTVICVSNPAVCIAGKITGFIQSSMIEALQEVSPEAAQVLGAVQKVHNQVKSIVDSGGEVLDGLRIDDEKGVVGGKLSVDDVQDASELVKEKGLEKFEIGKSSLLFNEDGSFNVEFDKVNSFVKFTDSLGIERSFENILSSKEGVPAFLKLSDKGEVVQADFTTNLLGGEYKLGGKVLSLPANTRLQYDKNKGKIELDVKDGKVSLDDLAKEDLKSDVVVRGENVELPSGEMMREGEVVYDEFGGYVPKNTEVVINGKTISGVNDVYLTEHGSNYVIFDGDGFEAVGSGFQVSVNPFLKADIDLPSRGYYRVGDEGVGDINRFLADYYGEEVEGNLNEYSEWTKDMIIKYQRDNSLQIDGLVGKETLSSMKGFPSVDLPSRGYFDLEDDLDSSFGRFLGVGEIYDKSAQQTVMEFQEKWNSLHEDDKIVVDGLLGGETLSRMQRAYVNEEIFSEEQLSANLREGVVEYDGYANVEVDGSAGIDTGNYVLNYVENSEGVVSVSREYESSDGRIGATIKADIYETKVNSQGMDFKDNGRVSIDYEKANYVKENYACKTSGTCGKNVRRGLIYGLDLSDEEFIEILGKDGSKYGFHAKNIEERVEINGGSIGLDVDESVPGDIVHFSTSGNEYRHAAIVINPSSSGETMIYHQFGKNIKVESLDTFLGKYNRYYVESVSRPAYSKLDKFNPNFDKEISEDRLVLARND